MTVASAAARVRCVARSGGRTDLRGARLHQPFDEWRRQRLVEREPDRSFRRLVAGDVDAVGPEQRGRDRVEADVPLERRVPEERPPVEAEAGDAVAEMLDGA